MGVVTIMTMVSEAKKLQPFVEQAASLIMAEHNALGLLSPAHFSPVLFLSFLP